MAPLLHRAAIKMAVDDERLGFGSRQLLRDLAEDLEQNRCCRQFAEENKSTAAIYQKTGRRRQSTTCSNGGKDAACRRFELQQGMAESLEDVRHQ